MKVHVFMAAAAASVLLTSAAFASIGGIPHETRRTGDRFIEFRAIEVVVFDLNKFMVVVFLSLAVDPCAAQV